ncbi:MAG: hypothetical protein WAW00_01680 [Candidatus Moraniibacteriota bacterium]
MFSILKLIIWLAGVAVIAYFALPYFGYEVNLNYWNDRKAACQEKLQQCQKDLIKGGIEGARENCDFQCINPKLLIEKQ